MAPLTNVVGVPLDSFPDAVRETLAMFDQDGDGTVDMWELREAATMFKNAKANPDGSIFISNLPEVLQAPLKAFDTDGDGTIDANELGHAAMLYTESKKQVKRLTKQITVLIFVLAMLCAAMAGLTAWVVEASKETKTDITGITLVAGSTTPAATAVVSQELSLNMTYHASDEYLSSMTSLSYVADDNTELMYTIVGSERDAFEIRLYASRGDVITITEAGSVGIKKDDGTVRVAPTVVTTGRRHLLEQLESVNAVDGTSRRRLRGRQARGRGGITSSGISSFMVSNRAGSD